MFVDNRSRYAVRALATPWSSSRSIALTTYRTSYQLGPSGLVAGELLPVQGDRLSAIPVCVGTSWSLTGTAVSSRPTRELMAEVRAGDRSPVSLRVLGDRVWQRRGDALLPSQPESFESMSLGSERAFGGTIHLPAGERDGLPHPALELAHPANPRGRGYFIDAADVEGGKCPNLEFPDSPLGAWPHQPDPAVLAPDESQLAPRLAEGGKQLEREPEIATLRLCHPGHWRSFDGPLRAGDGFALVGFRPQSVAFSLPPAPVLVEVRQSRTWHSLGYHIRHVHVALDQTRIEIVFGHSASYSQDHPVTDMRIREAA